jgi:hypothetical protein
MAEKREHSVDPLPVDDYGASPVANDVPEARYVSIWVPEEFVRHILADVAHPPQGLAGAVWVSLAGAFWGGVAIGMLLGSPIVGLWLYVMWR